MGLEFRWVWRESNRGRGENLGMVGCGRGRRRVRGRRVETWGRQKRQKVKIFTPKNTLSFLFALSFVRDGGSEK